MRGTMRFAGGAGAHAYLLPGLPVYDGDRASWVTANRRIVEAACEANGTGEIERRPLIAVVGPGRKSLTAPEEVLTWLVDLPIDAVYVQPLNLDPIRDSFEKLALYVEYLRAFRFAELLPIAGRVGAFGLVLQALDVPAFDSGLGDAERFAISGQNRRPKKRESGATSGGRDRRLYVEQLKTTLPSKYADPLLAELGVRARFTCSHGCCRHRGFEDLAERRRPHYLWSRDAEVPSCVRSRRRTFEFKRFMNSSARRASMLRWSAVRSFRKASAHLHSSTSTAGSDYSGGNRSCRKSRRRAGSALTCDYARSGSVQLVGFALMSTVDDYSRGLSRTSPRSRRRTSRRSACA